jgi:Holliday junction resolvasome RuvABC endonuclease subunit
MKQTSSKLILAVVPSKWGFGYAILEGQDRLVDWGVKTVTRDKNVQCLSKVEKLLSHYVPGVIVIEDYLAKGCRRSQRLRQLNDAIAILAKKEKIEVEMFAREQVMNTFFVDGGGTKHAVAKLLSIRFSEELGDRMPPKRKPWMSQDYRMGIFDAVALALVLRLKDRVNPNR